MSSLKMPTQVKRELVPFRAGTKRSVMRLNSLGFDPINELVKQYRKLELELQRQEAIRDGTVIEYLSTGKPRSYRPEVHHNIYNMLIVIGDKLLRYGYGRVPEIESLEERKPQPLIVNLSQEGDTFKLGVNDVIEEIDEYEELA